MHHRDPSLLGTDEQHVIETGLTRATWYLTDSPSNEIMRHSDEPAIRDTLIWFAALIGFARIGLPYMYGAWQIIITGLFQRAALTGKVIDHRLCSHKILMIPISRFNDRDMN